MSDVEKLVKKVHSPKAGYGCNEYDEVPGEDNAEAPYYVAWVVNGGVRYYLVHITLDATKPDNVYLGWVPSHYILDMNIGEMIAIQSSKTVRFALFNRWDKEKALDIAYDSYRSGSTKPFTRAPKVL